MKKLFPLIVLAPLCLASCGETSYAGKYKFLLGKEGENETRIGLEVTLKDDAYTIPAGSESLYTPEQLEQMKKAKKFSVSVDLGSTFDSVTKDLELPNSIDGYYLLLDEVDPTYGTKMSLGIDINLSELGIPDLPITSELIRNVMVSYVDGKNITLQLPVSITDLQHQLCWYSGEYFDIDPYIKSKIHDIEDVFTYLPEILTTYKHYDLETISPLPGKSGIERFGTHPEYVTDDKGNVTKDEISEMNQKYAGVFSNTFVYNDSTDEKIGSIYSTEVDEETTYYYFYPLEGFEIPSDGYFTGKIYEPQLFDDDREVKVMLQVDKTNSNKLIYVETNGAQYEYENEQEIDVSTIMKEGFEFRDFHDIKVQLKKE